MGISKSRFVAERSDKEREAGSKFSAFFRVYINF